MNDPMKKSLDDLLADLPRDVPPPPYLWSGIGRRLQRRSRSSRPVALAAAAGVAGACLASALTWAVLHGRSTAPAPVVVAAAPAPSLDGPRNASYVAARDSLEVSFRERLALLDPATRAKIEANLAIIRQAHEDIRKALASDPASPVLEQLWQSTWHDEIDLYEHVVQATQPTMTRI
ncbi:MAG: hypothetical protein WBF21_23760 [Steroidobacteraceae bacterium]